MITIELMGGLGNQLFQIFAAIGYSYRYHTPFYFESKNISIGWRKKQYWNTFLSSLNSFIQSREANIGYRDPAFHFTEIPFLGKIDVKLCGYFQSYKYFDEYKREIFDLMELGKRKSKLRQKLIVDSENTISMHFRIGDYKNIQEHHPILPIEYYERALQKVCDQTGKQDWTILYVCEEDDILFVSDMINRLKKLFPDLTFTKLDGGLADWEQMLAMSVCRHHIIANSTFSWFGAYFNTNPDKIVYYPSVWFGPAQGTKYIGDLFPKEWNKINIS